MSADSLNLLYGISHDYTTAPSTIWKETACSPLATFSVCSPDCALRV